MMGTPGNKHAGRARADEGYNLARGGGSQDEKKTAGTSDASRRAKQRKAILEQNSMMRGRKKTKQER
jgi:hypothetical protein